MSGAPAFDPSGFSPVGDETIVRANTLHTIASQAKIDRTTGVIEKQLHKSIQASTQQKRWVNEMLLPDLKKELLILIDQVDTRITDKKQRKEALKILGKLEMNINSMKEHPPDNFENLLKGVFKDFEKEFQNIFSKVKNKYDQMNPYLSYAVSKLSATALNTYLELNKNSLMQNPIFQARGGYDQAKFKEYLIGKLFNLAMPELKEGKALQLAVERVMKISLLSLTGMVVAYEMTLEGTKQAEEGRHPEDLPSDGHETSAHEMSHFAYKSDAGGGGAIAEQDSHATGHGEIGSLEAAHLAAESPGASKGILKAKFPTHDPLLIDANKIKRRIGQIKDTIERGITNNSITNEEIEFYTNELKSLQEDLKYLQTHANKISKTAITVVSTNYKIIITLEILHILELSTKGKFSSELIDKGIYTTVSSLFQFLKKADSELEKVDFDSESPEFIRELFQLYTDNMKGVLVNISIFKDMLKQVMKTRLSSSDIIAFTLDMVPFVHTIGLGAIAGLHLYNVKNIRQKRKVQLEHRLELERRSSLVQIMLAPDQATIISSFNTACQKVGKHPHLKLEKEEKKAITDRYKALKSKIANCKNPHEFISIMREIQNLDKDKEELVIRMLQCAKAIETDMREIIESSENVDKEVLKEKQSLMQDITKETQELELIALRANEFMKSKELFTFGLQMCIGSFLESVKKEEKEITPIHLKKGDKATKIYEENKVLLSRSAQGKQPLKASSELKPAVKSLSDKTEQAKEKSDATSVTMHRQMATIKCKKSLDRAVESWVVGMEALGLESDIAVKTLYENTINWNLADLGLNQKHLDALIQFNKRAPEHVKEQFEMALLNILANQYKSSEKQIALTNRTLKMSIGYAAFHNAHFGVYLAATAGALSNPISAPIIASLGVIGAASYTASKYKEEKFPETKPEVIRQEQVFINVINILTNPCWENDVPETEIDRETLELVKEAGLVLAGISKGQQKEYVARAAFAIDQFSVRDIEQGLHQFHHFI